MSPSASLDPVSAPVAARKAAPVTAHPWFAAIVALWFAALLGLSSLALAPAMLERIVAASGIASFVSAAAPPLGQTARLLVALGLAGLGGVVGLLLGRMLAGQSHRDLRESDVVYGSTDGEVEVDAPEPGTGDSGIGLRDRLARLTGKGDGPRDFDDLPRLRIRDRHPDAPGRKPLSLSDMMARGVRAADNGAAPDEVDSVSLPEIGGATSDDSILHEAPLDEAPASQAAAAPAPFSSPAPRMADDWAAPEPFTAPEAPADEVVPAFATDVAKAEEPLEREMATAAAAPTPHFAAVPASGPAIAEAALDALGVVQLTERLAIAMRARRARDARRAQFPETLAPAALAEELPIVQPSLRPVEPAPVSAPAVAVATPPAEAGLDGAALESGYSSLLGLSRPSRPNGSAPAASPPGPFSMPSAPARFAVNASERDLPQSAPSKFPATGDPAENYRALKAALASLQRISGTR